MRAKDRLSARRQLDKRLNKLRNSAATARPAGGWVKAIREALGMTTAQLGERIGVSQSRAVEIERNEVSGAITLGSLQRAANALDCELVYTLVPRRPLETLVEERARRLARHQLAAAGHSMALEDQRVDEEDAAEQMEALTRQLVEKSGSVLWRDE